MEDLTMKCLRELVELRNNANVNELIALQISTFDDYLNWRKQFPLAEPWEFYLRPGAPDVIAIRKKYEEELIRAWLNKK